MTTSDNTRELPEMSAAKIARRALSAFHPPLIICVAVAVSFAVAGTAWEQGHFDRSSIPEERAIHGSELVHRLRDAGITRVQRLNSSFRVEVADIGKITRGVCPWNGRTDPAPDYETEYCQTSDRSGYDYILDLQGPNVVYRGDVLSEHVAKADFLAWMALDAQLAIKMVEKARQERRRQEAEQRAWSEPTPAENKHPSPVDAGSTEIK